MPTATRRRWVRANPIPTTTVATAAGRAQADRLPLAAVVVRVVPAGRVVIAARVPMAHPPLRLHLPLTAPRARL